MSQVIDTSLRKQAVIIFLMFDVARAVKRRQTRDFMIAWTKFCGLFGVLEI
jgi:hypothetical protein